MNSLMQIMNQAPVVPYIRQCDFAVRQPWTMPERRLLDYLLIYVQEGACRFHVDDHAYRFEKGEFCLIQPGSVTTLEGLSNTVTPFAHFDIFFNPEREHSFPTRAGQVDLSAYSELLQPRLDNICGKQIPVRLKPSNMAAFRKIFLQVVEHWQYSDPLLQLKAQNGLTDLVISLLEQYFPVQHSQKTSPQTLNWITSYFSLHLNEPLSITDMSRRANLSPSRFHTVFKQQYGMTPYQYLLEMRISHACELLRNTDLAQDQIAEYCGFADIHHFSKAFRKRVGCSPGQYKQTSKNAAHSRFHV